MTHTIAIALRRAPAVTLTFALATSALLVAACSDAPSGPSGPGSAGVTLRAVAPDSLVEGATATLTGTGFSATPAENRVTVDGVPATVAAAARTSLMITVPRADCRPAREVEVRVAVGTGSDALTHPLRPAAYVDLPVGRQLLVRDPAEFCLHFAPSAAAEAYLIGVQSVSEVPSSLTPVDFRSAATPGAASGMIAAGPLATQEAGAAERADRSAEGDTSEVARWHRQFAAEAKLRQWDREFLARYARASSGLAARTSATAPSFPSSLRVGDVVSARVPDFAGGNLCAGLGITISAVVRTIGARAIWLEDRANPPGGFTLAQILALSDMFDRQIYPTATEYFGTPTDVDGNGRIVVVMTKEINKVPGFAGIVRAADMAPRTTCPGSNEGEVYYGAVPDPNGTLGQPLSPADLLAVTKRLLAHELTHIIQFGRRFFLTDSDRPVLTTWQLEGQAMLAQEVVGHQVTGRRSGQNYGFDIAANTARAEVWWYDGFEHLTDYFGFETRTSKIANAPEQCSWLGSPSEGNTGPCTNGQFLFYGVAWSFLRWLTDQFGPTYPGGEKALHQALIVSRLAGYAAVEDLVRVPIDSLLAEWAATLYVDDRVPGASARLTLPSWNLFDFNNRIVEPSRLIPRERSFASFADEVSVRGGSTAYFRMSGAAHPPTAIAARAAGGAALPAHMRLWVVRLQ